MTYSGLQASTNVLHATRENINPLPVRLYVRSAKRASSRVRPRQINARIALYIQTRSLAARCVPVTLGSRAQIRASLVLQANTKRHRGLRVVAIVIQGSLRHRQVPHPVMTAPPTLIPSPEALTAFAMPDSLAVVTAAHLVPLANIKLQADPRNVLLVPRESILRRPGPSTASPAKKILTPSAGAQSAFAMPGLVERCVTHVQKGPSRLLQETLNVLIALPERILIRWRQRAAISATQIQIRWREAARVCVSLVIREGCRA